MINTLIIIYGSPEAYPPTLNTIRELERNEWQLDILYRPNLAPSWHFGESTRRFPVGKLISPEQQEKLNIIGKLKLNIAFLIKLISLSLKVKYDLYLIYDDKALSLYALAKPFLPKGILWFHSHDVSEKPPSGIKKYLDTFRVKALQQASLVTLPAMERLRYIPVGEHTRVEVIPNFPAIAFYEGYRKGVRQSGVIKLLYQGAISDGHGLMELIIILSQPINGKQIELHLAGPSRGGYVEKLMETAKEAEVSSQVVYHGLLPYEELPKLTVSCDIGVAINEPKGIIYQTGGTASNKIYEYAACSLPILYYDSEHYRDYLGRLNWAFETDLTQSSLLDAISKIDEDYNRYSVAAKDSFLSEYNYEKEFTRVNSILDFFLR